MFISQVSTYKTPKCCALRINIPNRVSTKWLNLLRYFRANFFLRTFALFLRMKRNEFCAVLRYFFAQFAQNRKFYAKCNFLGKLSKIDILNLELNNWRFISYIKKILTSEYDNDYTTLNWLLPVTKSLN